LKTECINFPAGENDRLSISVREGKYTYLNRRIMNLKVRGINKAPLNYSTNQLLN
jgi:hypothetical protein